MATLTAPKIAEVLFGNFVETFESQQMLLPMVDRWTPEAGDLQNAANYIWRPVQQHAPVLEGFDLTGLATGIIQESYPAILGTPTNDFVDQSVADVRDIRFWEERGEQSGRRQASYLNSKVAQALALQGSLHIRSDATSGYDFISEAQALMNERQFAKKERFFLLNDRDTQTYSKDLAARQTLQGRPAETWNTGQIGSNVAEFDVYTGSFLPNLVGGASPNTTVTGNQSFAPQGGSVDASTGVVTNIDYRIATIAVAASASYNVGDKIQFVNDGTPVYALGLDDKTDTNSPMTFTIVAKPNGTSISVYPKPIAFDDPALSTLEKAYANVNTRILNGAVVQRLNTDARVRTNLFWSKDAVEVMTGAVPMHLFKEFSGKKVITETMKNGQIFYCVYDGGIDALNLRFRIFTWYGITVKKPQEVGVATRYTST